MDLFVGDYVEVDEGIITAFYPRKNRLIRPYVANIDVLMIVIAPVPKPDFLCVEKLILNCHVQKIEPCLVINKTDVAASEAVEEFARPYLKEFKVFRVSAFKEETLAPLKEYIEGKLVCFAGQSAVGKSSIINALTGKTLEVGELSKRIARGKNTTRHIEIFPCCGGYVVDTCGFSVMEQDEVKAAELVYYYDELLAFQSECRYTNCTHTKEPFCAVKKAVEEGKIDKDRYERYLKLFNALEESGRKKYD